MCPAAQADTDLFGADLPDGTLTGVASYDACCAACAAKQGCGAFVFFPAYTACFLKAPTGWTSRPLAGLQSGVLAGTPVAPPTGPTGPTGPEQPPTPGPVDPNAQTSPLWGVNGELYKPGGRLSDWSQAGYGGAWVDATARCCCAGRALALQAF